VTRTYAASGTYTVTLTVTDNQGATATKAIQVTVSGGSTPPPPPSGPFQRVIADTVIQGNLVVPDGQTWLIGRNVQIAGNLRTVGGTIAMRPGSTLKFLGANPDAYVGGGLTYSDQLVNDIGLWVGPQGVLDVQCTPKTAWNRTGADPSWLPGDELWIAPSAVGDFYAKRWTPGSSVPRVGSSVPATEVVNVTRDCVIEGPGHIHIHSNRAQRIEYVQLKSMGISNQASQGAVLGRYALHLHFAGDGSRGTIIRGVAAVGSKGKVFVPHGSHGITMTDNVSVNSWGEGMWWDLGHATNDLLIDRMAVVGVYMPDAIGGGVSGVPAYTLGGGTNMEIKNSVAAGVMGGMASAVGFDWPEPTTVMQPVVDRLVWKFDAGNVAHNNRGPGIRFWTNNQDAHVVNDYVSYRNGVAGIENGAYFSGTEYHNITSFEDGYQYGGGVSDASGFYNNASAAVNPLGRIMQLTNCNITSRDGPALKVGHRQLPGSIDKPFLIQDCTFTAQGNPSTVGVSLPAWPKVWVHHAVNPWFARFVRTNVLPEDIVFEPDPENNGSVILIDHADGRKWTVSFENGVKVVRTR
jgi:PKD repeat protein